jgi:hypothetical protein
MLIIDGLSTRFEDEGKGKSKVVMDKEEERLTR